MPRKRPGKRGESWEIKTKPDLLSPILEAKHSEMVKDIKQTYFSIDRVYERVAEILDNQGIHTQARLLYRSFAEELFKLTQKYTSKALENMAEAIAIKYLMFGLDRLILKQISKLFNLEAPRYKPWPKSPTLIQIPGGIPQGNKRIPIPLRGIVVSGGTPTGNKRIPRPVKGITLSWGKVKVAGDLPIPAKGLILTGGKPSVSIEII